MIIRTLNYRPIALVFCHLLFCIFAYGQTSTLVSLGANGKLIYTCDSKGNRIPDFSGVGYRNSECEIPKVAVG